MFLQQVPCKPCPPPPQKICMQMKIGLRYIDSLNGQLIVEPFEKRKMTNVCQEHWLD